MKSNWLSIGAVGSLIIIMLVFGYILVQFSLESQEDTETQQIQVIESAIRRAAVQCYALEGSYPPNVAYLEENYGISYDHKKYLVHYRAVFEGSSLGPEIIVFKNDTATNQE